MMPIQLITANPTFKKNLPNHDDFLEVSEFFCDTIQGENFIGYPAAFLRLQGCTLSCSWCDTQEVWRYGNSYTFGELFELMMRQENDLIMKLFNGQHLVITGGSPLRQQDKLIRFISEFINVFHFKPFIEIENECTVMPHPGLIQYVNCWNNSPKLSNSGNLQSFRHHPLILQRLMALSNSWFKFVVSNERQWQEIEHEYLVPRLIRKDQIVLMPLGGDREELEQNRETVIEMAIRYNVRYSTREHIVVWDKKTGI